MKLPEVFEKNEKNVIFITCPVVLRVQYYYWK